MTRQNTTAGATGKGFANGMGRIVLCHPAREEQKRSGCLAGLRPESSGHDGAASATKQHYRCPVSFGSG